MCNRVTLQTGRQKSTVADVVEATFEEMVAAFKRGESVSLRNFGTFYVRPKHSSTVFYFNSYSGYASCLAGSLL